MRDVSEFERDYQQLSAELRKLEGEYTMYFAGRLPRPPWETRSRVEQLVRQLDRRPQDSLSLRFRFQMLQSRFTKFVDLWDRTMRAREEGRSSPLGRRPDVAERPQPAVAEPVSSGTVHVATFTDPREEADKLHDLYGSLMDARRQAGEAVVPFHKFAAMVKEQVNRLKSRGAPEVTFKVTTVEGRVNLTAKVATST